MLTLTRSTNLSGKGGQTHVEVFEILNHQFSPFYKNRARNDF